MKTVQIVLAWPEGDRIAAVARDWDGETASNERIVSIRASEMLYRDNETCHALLKAKAEATIQP